MWIVPLDSLLQKLSGIKILHLVLHTSGEKKFTEKHTNTENNVPLY